MLCWKSDNSPGFYLLAKQLSSQSCHLVVCEYHCYKTYSCKARSCCLILQSKIFSTIVCFKWQAKLSQSENNSVVWISLSINFLIKYLCLLRFGSIKNTVLMRIFRWHFVPKLTQNTCWNAILNLFLILCDLCTFFLVLISQFDAVLLQVHDKVSFAHDRNA